MNLFKVGDNVRRKTTAIYLSPHPRIIHSGVITSINNEWLRFGPNGYNTGGWLYLDYELVPVTYGPLDVTKPCQYEDGVPVYYIGKTRGGLLVFDAPGYFITRDETGCSKDLRRIFNTPPPPEWPKTVYIVYKLDGSIQLAKTPKARDNLKKSNYAGVEHFVQEVILNGKA